MDFEGARFVSQSMAILSSSRKVVRARHKVVGDMNMYVVGCDADNFLSGFDIVVRYRRVVVREGMVNNFLHGQIPRLVPVRVVKDGYGVDRVMYRDRMINSTMIDNMSVRRRNRMIDERLFDSWM